MKDNAAIKEIAYDRMLCDGVENEQLLKRRAEFWYYDNVGLELAFIELEAGHTPQAENEVITDSKTLELLGIPLELGAKIILQLDIRGEKVTRDFTLCGWWTSDPVFNVGQIFASRAYVDAHAKELENAYYDDYSVAGAINAYIMFKNSFNLQSKLDTLLAQSGFSSVETDANYVASNVNWSYISTNFGMDAGTMTGLGCGLLLIVFTGYLIIYNVFQISIVRDIRFYGLLKTIGTTSRQIKTIIRRQALILSAIGIPIGLVLGFFCGKIFVPLLMSNTSYAGTAVTVSPNPLIFIGAALFALVTVFISTFKPARVAAGVSPVDAVRYVERDTPNKTHKNTADGAKMPRMAMANIGRNKKRTALVIVSLSLSIVLLNTVVTLSGSIDMDKFLSKFSDTDFLIAHADYFNNDYLGAENAVSESFISAVNAQDGFEEGGRLYGGRENMFYASGDDVGNINKNDKGDAFVALYGLEALPLERLTLLDGEIDTQKLLSGKYILEGVQTDDNETPEWDTSHYKVGDKVTLHNNKGGEYTDIELEVIGHVAVHMYTNSDRSYWGYTFYLPAEVYKTLVDAPAVMSYAFNVADDKEAQMEQFLKNYTENAEPLMNYDSKFTTMASFSGMQNTVLLVGGALAGIIGMIGVLNFINAMLTSIVSRKKELAMLQSIGMTRKQLKQMLCCEGVYYAVFAGACSILLGIAGSLLIVKPLCEQMWFTSYNFVYLPLVIAVPVLLLLGISVPLAVYSVANKQSIVEMLRES